MKKYILLSSLFLGLTTNIGAHEGHHHKIMGTVVSVDQSHVKIKGTDDKTTSVTLTPETTFHQGKASAAQKDIHIGGKIVVMGMPGADGQMTAMDVQLPVSLKKKAK